MHIARKPDKGQGRDADSKIWKRLLDVPSSIAETWKISCKRKKETTVDASWMCIYHPTLSARAFGNGVSHIRVRLLCCPFSLTGQFQGLSYWDGQQGTGSHASFLSVSQIWRVDPATFYVDILCLTSALAFNALAA